MNRQNRPRNRQPRPAKDQRPPRSQNFNSNNRAAQASSVPNITQVIPGASVSIVLKEDQPTGDETKGIVQDVLTKGNHPRGIKVRLRDGQVGRVQRMMPGDASSTSTSQPVAAVPSTSGTTSSSRFTHRYTDVRNEDEFAEGPPPRSLADFFPPELDTREPEPKDEENAVTTARCPVCDAFEGDELAVSYHIERDCLAG